MGPHLVQPLSKSPTAITENSKASRRNIWKNYSPPFVIIRPKACYFQALNGSTNPLATLLATLLNPWGWRFTLKCGTKMNLQNACRKIQASRE
jgi:hypothetical protein